jgi:hypothetical protein
VEVIRPVRCHTERGESLSYCGQGEEQQSRSSSGSSQYHLPSRIWREPARLRLRGLAELREGWHRGAFWQLLACCWLLAVGGCVCVCLCVCGSACCRLAQAQAHPHRRYAGRCLLSAVRGSLLNSLGCSLDPPAFASAIRCHQKSTSNSAGSSVGSLVLSLSTPPGHPAPRGSAVCACRASSTPVLPLLLCTRPARARPSVGGQRPTPNSRSAPAPVESSPGLVLSSAVTGDFRAVTRNPRLAHEASRLPIEIDTTVLLRSLRRAANICSRRQRSHGR